MEAAPLSQYLSKVELDRLPPAVSGLTRLQRLGVQSCLTAAPQLPGSPMLRNLRWLGACLNVLANSTQALEAAESLETVFVLDSSWSNDRIYWYSPASAALFGWLASHPPLRHLSIDAFWDLQQAHAVDWPGFVRRLLQLLRHRPQLCVQCPGFGDDEGEVFFMRLSHNQ